MTWVARIKRIRGGAGDGAGAGAGAGGGAGGGVSVLVEFEDGNTEYEKTFSGCCCDNGEYSSLSSLIHDEINRIQDIKHFPP